jgi:hypothetical protein
MRTSQCKPASFDHEEQPTAPKGKRTASSSGGLLGPEMFLALYGDGLERFGYRNSPLERMAYDLQGRFDREAQPFDAEAVCEPVIHEMRNAQA